MTLPPRTHLGRLSKSVPLLLLLLVTALLLLRRIDDPSIYYPDSKRILMDGVFVLDFLKAMPLDRIYEFTTGYYAQYPAITIGYRPPFFPLVEACFNAVFGVNVWSSRLAVVLLALLGVTAWFKLLDRVFDTETAFAASLLLVSTPYVVQWGWYTMNDLPVLSLAMMMAYLFHRSTDARARGYVGATALVFIFAVATKQVAVFLASWPLLSLAGTGRLREYLSRGETRLSIALVVLLAVVPLGLLTLWLGGFNILQSIGSGSEASPLWRARWSNLTLYPLVLAREQLTPPVLPLALFGMLAALLRRDARSLDFAIMIGTSYAFFTYLVAKDWRYTLFWIPAITLFASLPLSYLPPASRGRRLALIALSVLGLYQIAAVYAKQPSYAAGYTEAARYIAANQESTMVLFDGHNSENFIYAIRVLDQSRTIFVLRSDKLLTSSLGSPNMWQQEHVHSRSGIRDLLDRFGVVHIVVEREERSGRQIHRELRRFLESGPFELIHEIPIETNWSHLEGQTLRIYRYLEPKPRTADHIELRLPLVGATINVRLPPATAR